MILAPVVFIVILIFSVILHELAHGVVADRLGDPTARLAGRLTLNPIPHIDVIGSIILPAMLIFLNTGLLFGWAKPVPIDPYNLKNPRKDTALISLAGPFTNIMIAVITSIILRILLVFGGSLMIIEIISYLLVSIIQLNVMLAVFNLLPIHPLDGFKIVGGLLPEKRAHEWYQLERFGYIFLLLLIVSPGMLQAIVGPVISLLSKLLLPSAGVI